jgi:hypothetical protein
MNATDTRPVVSEVIRETGVTASDLRSVVPGLSLHMARHIVRGTSTGVTYARQVAAGLRRLAQQQGERIDSPYWRAADRLEAAYPVARVPSPKEKPKDDPDALVIYLSKRQESFASIGRRVGISREAVRQRVATYERRTGEKIPRCGTDY